MTVHPGEIAEPMSVEDKIVGGIKDSVSLFSALGWIVSAGYDQVANSSPNYGTNATAFGQRFGAAVARDTSEGIFSRSLFAPFYFSRRLRDTTSWVRATQDSSASLMLARVASSPALDSGHMTPNFALLAGNAGGAALTVTYYPGINTTASGC